MKTCLRPAAEIFKKRHRWRNTRHHLLNWYESLIEKEHTELSQSAYNLAYAG